MKTLYINRIRTCIVLTVVVCFFLSCKDKKDYDLTKTEYKWYNLQHQGWKSKRVNQFIADINYTATEVPLQYYLLKQLGDNHAKIDSIYSANNKERIVEIEFRHVNEEDLLQEQHTKKNYQDGVKYMAFGITKDFKVVTSSNDTIKCSGVNFERNFKVAPFKRLLLHFNEINPDDTIQLIYQDELFGNGIIKFNFDNKPLKL